MNCVYYDVEGKKSFIPLCNSDNKSLDSNANLYTNKGEKAVEINPGFWYTIIMYPYARGRRDSLRRAVCAGSAGAEILHVYCFEIQRCGATAPGRVFLEGCLYEEIF